MDKIISRLTKIFKAGKPSHAYLFWGPKYTGKFDTALKLATSLYGEKMTADEILKGKNPEVSVLNQGESIKIDEIRDLTQKLSLSSFGGDFKIAIINHAENLTLAAANALLKTIEEPSDKTVVLLITERREALPTTILSRCQQVSFRLNQESVKSFLDEQESLAENDREDIVQFAFGRLSLARKIVDHPELLEELREKAGTFRKVFAGNLAERFALAGELAKKNGEDVIFDDLDAWWRSSNKSLEAARILVAAEETENFQVNRRLMLESLFIGLGS